MTLNRLFLCVGLVLAVCGCGSPTTDGWSVFILGDRPGASSAYVVTPDLMRYDGAPDSVRLRQIATFDHEVQTYFYTDSLFVGSEVIPGEDNRVTVVDTRTGRRQSWRYTPACAYDGGRDQMTATTVRERGQLVTYWGCSASPAGDGTGYALNLDTRTLQSGPTVREPADVAPILSGTGGRVEETETLPAPPAGYTAYDQGQTLAVVRDTMGAWALWDGTRLFPLDVQAVRVPGAGL